jgi:long-chain acyl-CoA synthetase
LEKTLLNKNYANSFDKHAIALNDGVHQLSYGELLSYIKYLNQYMHALSISEGDRVLILLPNGIHHTIAVFAAFSLGCVVVPLDVETNDTRLKYIMNHVDPALCIGFFDHESLHGIDVFNPENLLYERVKEKSSPESRLFLNQSKFEKARLLLFSSGSTGYPKAVMIDYLQQSSITKNITNKTGIKKGDKELLLAQGSHSDGWQRVMVTLYNGGQIVFPQGLLSVSNILETIAEEKITTLFIHPTLLRYLLKTKKEKVSQALKSCRSIKTGGAGLRPDELETFLSLVPHADVYIHYGMSESPRSTMARFKHGDTNLNFHTVGLPMPGVNILIVDASGQSVSTGEVGQILIKGSHLSAGYWHQNALSVNHLHDGWLHTGDYGSMDEHGALYFHGRRDDLMTTLGHSFYPAEVERLLGIIPNIEEYLVIGIPDSKGMIGDEPWIFVVPEENSNWNIKQFYDFARPILEKYMMPRRVIEVSEIPKTPSGKPHRKKMKELFYDAGERKDET